MPSVKRIVLPGLSTTQWPDRLGRAAVMMALLLALALPVIAWAGDKDQDDRDTWKEGAVVLPFEPTIMLTQTPNGSNPSVKGMDVRGYMVIHRVHGQTDMQFFLRGARPNTLYTIWTTFKPLQWCTQAELQASPGCPSAFPAGSVKPGILNLPSGFLPFYAEGGVVAPTASMAKAFTNGMGPDPGATFFTNGKGDGQVSVKLDYNLLGTTYEDGPPVGNTNTVTQCVVPTPGAPVLTPGKPAITSANCPKGADGVTPKFSVTSSWLRKYIVQTPDPVVDCANYEPSDPTSIYWQCIDPATVDPRTGSGLPRVWRFPFDHFRLAAHPDELTHGFIGGSNFEHAIDMVGRRCQLTNSCP